MYDGVHFPMPVKSSFLLSINICSIDVFPFANWMALILNMELFSCEDDSLVVSSAV
jgi:hypothetical protein